MKSTAQENAPSMTYAQLLDQVLRPKQPAMRTVVVLEALLLLYRYHAQSLPPDAMGMCSMAIANLAGDLLKASAAAQNVPAGASIH